MDAPTPTRASSSPTGAELALTTAPAPLTTTPLDQSIRLAKLMIASGYFADIRNVAQAVLKIEAGREIGFGPVASMRSVYVTDRGQIGYAAALIGAAIKRSGRYRWRILRHDHEQCQLEWLELVPTGTGSSRAWDKLGTSSFSIEEARLAGLLNRKGSTWIGYPRAMLFSRALTAGARQFCPEVFAGGVYTPDEIDEGEQTRYDPLEDELAQALREFDQVLTSTTTEEPTISGTDDDRDSNDEDEDAHEDTEGQRGELQMTLPNAATTAGTATATATPLQPATTESQHSFYLRLLAEAHQHGDFPPEPPDIATAGWYAIHGPRLVDRLRVLRRTRHTALDDHQGTVK